MSHDAGGTWTPRPLPPIILATQRPSRDLWALLPPELRNEISQLALPSSTDTVDITDPLPAITRTCQQMRAESIPVYFSTRHFHASIVDGRIKVLIEWLDIFRGFDKNAKRAFRGLRIFYRDRLVAPYSFYTCPHHWCRRWCPEFDHWNKLVSAIASTGLTAQQVILEPTLKEHFREYIELAEKDGQLVPLGTFGGTAYREGRELYLFTRFILPSLLRLHGLYEANAPPFDFLDWLLQNRSLRG